MFIILIRFANEPVKPQPFARWVLCLFGLSWIEWLSDTFHRDPHPVFG